MLIMRNIQDIIIDINKRTQQPITANVGEVGSRFIRIKIMNNNVPVDLTSTGVYLYALKPDNTKLFNTVTVEDVARGIVLAELTSQLLTSPGNVKLTLLLIEGNNKLESKEFSLKVDASIVSDSAIESANEFPALTKALGTVQGIDNRFKVIDGQINTIDTQIEQIDDKSSQALGKASNPIGALREVGYKIEKQDLSDEVITFVTGGTITDAKGLENNRGIDYPLKSVTRNSKITDITETIKNAVLDVKIIGAKKDKYYRLQYIGNGTTAWGDPYYGAIICEHDKGTFSTDSELSMKGIINRVGNYMTKPTGITTWIFRNKTEDITVNITIDFSKLPRDRYNLDDEATGYSSIIDESCYITTNLSKGTLNTNRELEYPFKNILRDGTLSPSINDDLKEAVLDVKIINAKPNKKYKIDWLGNGTTAWGNPEYAIYLQEMDDNFGNVVQIFNRANAHLDAPSKDIVTRIITSYETDIILSITIDYSKLKSDRYIMNTEGNLGYSSIIDESCYICKSYNLLNTVEDTSKLSLSKTGDTYLIKSPYDNTKNIVWKFSSLGINEILHLTAIYFQPVSAIGFDSLELFQTISTDWISPYNFSAKNNTVNNSTITTGGNHGTNSGGGFRTAYPEYKKCHIGDEEILKDGEYHNVKSIILESKTNIASSNVIDLDTGSGFRGVITEFITYRITPKTVKAMVSLLCNEDVVFRTYAGAQISALSSTYKNISFGGDTKSEIITDISLGYRTGTKAEGSKVDRFVCEHDTGYVVAYKDKNVGINDLKYMDDNTGIGQVTGTKAYLKNFENKPTDFNKGDNFYYNCIYSFNKKYECEGSMRAYKVDDIYIVDFNKGVTNTFFKVDNADINKKVEIIDSSNVSADNYSSSLGVKLTATNKGWIKFRLI